MPLRELLVSDEHGHHALAKGRVAHYPWPYRWTKAGIYLGGGLALGAVLVIVPFVQFFAILPPIFGLVLAIWTLQSVEHVDHVEATCPSCGAAVVLEGTSRRFPVPGDCPECRHVLSVEPTEDVDPTA